MSDEEPRKPHLVLVAGGPEDELPEADPNLEVPVELVRPEDLTPPRREFMQAAIEAVLFAASEPMSFDALRSSLGNPDRDSLQAGLTTLRESYLRRGAGVRLYEVANGYQLRSVAQAAPYVAASRNIRPLRLSKAAVETVAIVAYRQPVSRQEVEDIRGVDCGGILRTLLERGLLKVMGRRDEPGRPLVYGTTPHFLEVFGLKDLSDLPTLRDLRELQADDPRDGPVQLDFPDF
ncbi:MAG: SMC-Scp complex subunit ScpB [Alphaproteobacteria bacterium]|nr:SMC-Scp complex subunit ScpB [Alphaproteobacteria bacterium]MCB9791768.1 SMC-Scp complex subunit ScpB [Alphaproteobacteria bacterium]